MQSHITKQELDHLFGIDKVRNKNIATPYSRLARMLTGGYQWWEINKSEKTNQKYCYYYSCSGHGGFVVAYDMLTQTQKEKLNTLCKWDIKFEYVAYDALNNTARAGVRYISECERFRNVRFVCFEEDCGWSIAYKLGICIQGTEWKLDDEADRLFNIYYK